MWPPLERISGSVGCVCSSKSEPPTPAHGLTACALDAGFPTVACDDAAAAGDAALADIERLA